MLRQVNDQEACSFLEMSNGFYTGHIKPEHIQGFHSVIEQEGAVGGFFIHSGKTRQASKKLLDEFGINLISGQRLVNFVLGQQVKILGTTIPISKQRNNN